MPLISILKDIPFLRKIDLKISKLYCNSWKTKPFVYICVHNVIVTAKMALHSQYYYQP